MLGKGFVLDSAGTLTTTLGEVIAGQGSVKGAYAGTGAFTSYLHSDPSVFPLVPGRTYKVSFSYRVLATPTQGFEVLFYSPTGGGVGNFLPSVRFGGTLGDTGTAELTNTMGLFGDYRAQWNVVGTGSVAIDAIRIVDTSTGQLVAVEDAEGPSIDGGPLGFRLADAATLALGPPSQQYLIRSATVRDLDGDNYPEAVLTVTTYPDQLPQAPVIIGAASGLSFVTSRLFPSGTPTLRHSPVTLFADVNGDGLTDIIFAEAGIDHPPWTGSRIGIALNSGAGTYIDASSKVPGEFDTTRSYAIAAGDLDRDGRVEIVLPDQSDGRKTALLRWDGKTFAAQRNWVDPQLWNQLSHQNAMGLADLDADGWPDLLVTGDWSQPTLRLLFGNAGNFVSPTVLNLPDGPWGHMPFSATTDSAIPLVQGGDVDNLVVADFDNDGRPDIFMLSEQVLIYRPGVLSDPLVPGYADLRSNGGFVYGDIGLQVLMNRGNRTFDDVSSTSTTRVLGRKFYTGLVAIDLNNDGYMDVLGIYTTKPYGSDTGFAGGTTLFINDGTGTFQVVDGVDLLPTIRSNPPQDTKRWSLGGFLPTLVRPGRTEGIMVESVGTALNAYKVVADASIGTGPGFSDSKQLGVPGFNEFFYLRRYGDAAAAMRAGQFASGLAHYLGVGRAKGYVASAAALAPSPTRLAAAVDGSTVTLTWAAPTDSIAPKTYQVEAGSATGQADLAILPTVGSATTFIANAVGSGTYFVRVRAVGAAGPGAPSNELMLAVGAGSCSASPQVPAGLEVSVAGPTVTLSWAESPGAMAYLIEAGSAAGKADLAILNAGSKTSFTVDAPPGTYYVRLRGRNACGTSDASTEMVVPVLRG
jgi:hypothetical protein